MLAKHALYQLSYGPIGAARGELVGIVRHLEQVVGPGRFELPTSPLSGVRSNQLSYGPMEPHSRGRPPGARDRAFAPSRWKA